MGETETEVTPDETQPTLPETPDQPAPETEPVVPDESGGEGQEAEPAPPATTPDETQPQGMLTEADVKKFQKDVERLFRDNASRVGRIFGDDAVNLIECPFCIEQAPGFIWNPSVRPLSEGQMVAARMLLNIPVPTDYNESSVYRQCPTCAGKGSVRTGSLVPNNETAMCPECKGKGFLHLVEGVVQQNGYSHTTAEPVVTGPTVFDPDTPQQPAEDRPEAEALRRDGWLVVAPMAPMRPVS